MRRAWKKIRYRLEWLGLKSAAKFVPILSRKACYRLALLLGSLGAMLDRRGRRVALSNLRVAFGDEISSERRAQIVRESYQHFARTMLDFFWSPRLTNQNFSRYVEFENRERWDEEDTRPGKPVIVGCYHYSNFEWLSIVSAFAGLEGVVIAQQFKNPLLDPIFLKLRQRSGHRVAPREGAVMHLYRALRRGERFAPGNGAGLLGPVRAGCPEKSRPLALDVQALALPPAGGESGGVSILREHFGGFRAPSR